MSNGHVWWDQPGKHPGSDRLAQMRDEAHRRAWPVGAPLSDTTPTGAPAQPTNNPNGAASDGE